MNSVELVKSICKDRKIPISRLERDLGFSNGYIAQLRKGVFPAERLASIADYLSVPMDELMENGQKNKPTTDGSELNRDILLNALEGTDDMATLLAALDVINKKLQERR